MLYLLTVQFEKIDQEKKTDLYYSILGAILNLFDNKKEIYDGIVKLSFSLDEYLNITITIVGTDVYEYIVNTLLKDSQKSISVNRKILQLKQLKFKFETFSPNGIEYRDFDKFVLRFYSPTFVRQQKITHMLPNPSQFLTSVLHKLNTIFQLNIDENHFKKWLKNTVYVGEFNLSTRLVKIKQGKKAGVVGICTYYLSDKTHEENLRTLYILLQSIKFLGMGSGTKLGCGSVSCFISKIKKNV